MASVEVPVAPAPAAARPAGVTNVVGDYVAGLWYGEAPEPLAPSTSYVMPFERKASAQQRKAELERIKHDRAEADIAEAKRKGGVLGSIKATAMSVFASARGTTHAPASRKLARKEKKFNSIFKFAQPESLLYVSKKLRLINRHNNSATLGKLWISSNFVCFRESLRGAKARTMVVIPVREIVCIQRARALKVIEANAVPEFQPYNDMDSSADSLQVYMRDRELHQFTGFWDHKSLEDAYHTLDYVWRPQAYAAEIPPPIVAHHELPPAEASGSSSPSSDLDERHVQRTAPPYAAGAPVAAAAAVPVVAAAAAGGVAAHSLKEGEVLRTAPPYAAVAPVAPVAPPMPAPVQRHEELPKPKVSAPAPEIKVSPPEQACTTVCTTVPVAPLPAAAPMLSAAPALNRAQVVYSEPFVVRPVGQTAIVSSLGAPAMPQAARLAAPRLQLPVVPMEPLAEMPRRALPADLRSQIEGFNAFFPRRHVSLPARPPLSALFASAEPLLASAPRMPAQQQGFAPQTVRFDTATFAPAGEAAPIASSMRAAPAIAAKSQSLTGVTGGARRSYPRQPEALLREIRGFRRSRLLRPRVRRAWRAPAFAKLLREVRTFNLRKLKHVVAPIIRSQLPQVSMRRRGTASRRAYPSLMAAELKERIRAFASLNLISGFRHVTPVENRFLGELRAARLPLPRVRSSAHRQLLTEIVRFNHLRLRPTHTIRRRYAQYLGLDEIRKLNRTSPKLLQEIRAFDRTRLRRATNVRMQLPIQTNIREIPAEHHPEWSPVAHMPWWPALSAAIRQQRGLRLRHVQPPSVPLFRAPAAEQAFKATPMRDTTAGLSSAKLEVVEAKRVVIISQQMPMQATQTQGNAGFGAAGLSV